MLQNLGLLSPPPIRCVPMAIVWYSLRICIDDDRNNSLTVQLIEYFLSTYWILLVKKNIYLLIFSINSHPTIPSYNTHIMLKITHQHLHCHFWPPTRSPFVPNTTKWVVNYWQHEFNKNNNKKKIQKKKCSQFFFILYFILFAVFVFPCVLASSTCLPFIG